MYGPINAVTRLTLVAALLGVSGCMYDFDYFDDDDEVWAADPYYDAEYVELEATGASLNGELGLVELAGDARIHEAADWGYGASIELRGDGLGGVGMNRLTIDGVSIAELEPGTYESTRYSSAGDGDPNFSVTGCSGPRDDSWEYDVGAERVEVQVTELDSWTVRLDWTATFPETTTYGTADPTDVPSNTSSGTVVITR